MDKIKQYYEILGLQSHANADEIKQAYRNLAKLWHPDCFHHDINQQKAAEIKFKRIVEAYEILKDYFNKVKKFDNASNIYTHKASPELHYEQGRIYAEAEEYEKAIAEFSKAIRLDEIYIQAYQYRGFILSKLGYENRAKADFKKIDELKLKSSYQTNISQRKSQNSQQSSQTEKQSNNTKWHLNFKLQGHVQSVRAVAISPTLDLIASGSTNKPIKLWDLKTAKEITNFEECQSKINVLKFTPEGKFLIGGGNDKIIRVWDTKTFESRPLGSWKTGHNQAVLCFDISADGEILVSGSADKTVKIWQINSQLEPFTLTGYSAEILGIAISPNQEVFVSGGMDKNVRIRRLDNGKLLRSIKTNCGMTAVAFSPDNKILATGGFDRTIRLWYWETGEEIGVLKGHLDEITALIFTSDGKEIISSSLDESIKIWQLDTQKVIESLQENNQGVLSLDLSSDGNTLICGCKDNAIRVFGLTPHTKSGLDSR